MKEKHPIDHLFKNALEQHEALPSDQLWERISDGLFDQVFQNGLSELKDNPSSELWSKITQELEHQHLDQQQQFDQHFQKAFQSFEPEPTDTNWEKVKRKLPISLLLRNQLNQLSKMAGLLLLAFLIAFLLGQTGVIDRYLNPSHQNIEEHKKLRDKEALTLPPATERDEELSNDFTPLEDKDLTVSNETNTDVFIVQPQADGPDVTSTQNHFLTGNIAEKRPVSPLTKSQSPTSEALMLPSSAETAELAKDLTALPIISAQAEENHNTSSERRSEAITTLANRNQVFSFNENSHSIRLSPIAYKDNTALNAKMGNHLSKPEDDLQILETVTFTGWYASVYGQINNTWILSQNLRSQLADESAEYVLSLGSAFGVGVGHQLTPKVALEVNWLYANHGQEFQSSAKSGVYQTSQLSTNYHYVPLYLKYQAARMNNSGKLPMTWNYLFGVHYGYLGQAQLVSGAEEVTYRDILVQHELGLDLGFELHLFLSPQIFLTAGGHSSFGTQISRVGTDSPNSSNLNLGMQFGLHYRFLNKN